MAQVLFPILVREQYCAIPCVIETSILPPYRPVSDAKTLGIILPAHSRETMSVIPSRDFTIPDSPSAMMPLKDFARQISP